MEDWLLFLGAGASAGAPCSAPTFDGLFDAVMTAVDWKSEGDWGAKVWRFAGADEFPTVSAVDASPEVLFGTLLEVGVDFVEEACRVLGGRRPNAIHDTAAAVLAAGGCVWTTNVDDAVETACVERSLVPHRSGRSVPASRPGHRGRLAFGARRAASGPLAPLAQTRPGTYVKLHGTVDAPSSLAFTDRELMAPLDAADVRGLTRLAAGRTVVFFGYAGADADLADLLGAVLSEAKEVHWFEPNPRRQRFITSAFPNQRDRILFYPDPSVSPHLTFEDALRVSATSFETLSRAAGGAPTRRRFDRLLDNPPDRPTMDVKTPPAATHARLAERWGLGDDAGQELAWRVAGRRDLRAVNLPTLGLHAQHWRTRSLYDSGLLGRTVRSLVDNPDLLFHLRPKPLRDYVVSEGSALLLADPDVGWRRRAAFSEWATSIRSDANQPYPIDLYYRAQARRYAFRPEAALADALSAVEGLKTRNEPNRLAGAWFESGLAYTYSGRFTEALGCAFELRYRSGRYAIPRWHGWGAWLEGMVRLHLEQLAESEEPIEVARERFERDGAPQRIWDAQTLRLLRERLRLAQGLSCEEEVLDEVRGGRRVGRYQDDADLVLSDIAIARGDLAEASERLRPLGLGGGMASTPVSQAWAELGLAELDRLTGDSVGAASRFRSLEIRSTAVGANWLATQAHVGFQMCAPGPAPAARVEPDLPRVLWMVTL